MELIQKERFIFSWVFFAPGVVGLIITILMHFGYIMQKLSGVDFILSVIWTVLLLAEGSGLMILTLLGKYQKSKYPRFSKRLTIFIITLFSVLGGAFMILFFTVSSFSIIFSVWMWSIMGHSTWYYFNQKAFENKSFK